MSVDASQGHATQPASIPRESSSARRFRRVFTSYSHRDLQVVEATERYGRTLGDEYIRDLIYLRSGELWNDQLQQLVRRSDVFQLFWSVNAARSKYVEDEWRYALSLNRSKFVRPTYWQEPMPEPPELLRGIHFHRLITETQPQVLPPSIPEKDQKVASAEAPKPKPLPPEMRFMPSGGGVAKVAPLPNLPRTASYPWHKSWTLRGKLIFLGLVITAVLAVIALIMRS
jgi:TIR domain